MNEHLSPEAIASLVHGQASEEETERCLTHIDQCEPCLASMDQHWARQFGQGVIPSIPNLETSQVRAIEGRILRRIYASEVGKQALRLALVGPITLLNGLFRTGRRKR